MIDTDIASVAIAFTALAVSVAPHVANLMKGSRIRFNVPEVIAFNHYLGNINLNIFIDIRNVGGKAVNISKIECHIRNLDAEGDPGIRIPARTYYSRQPPAPGQMSAEFFIGTLTVKTGDHWSETVRFFNLWKRPDEEKVNEIVSNVRGDIFKKSRLGAQLGQNGPWEAEEGLVKAAIELFDKNFGYLCEGNYRITISVHSESEVLQAKSYDFTLFKNNIQSVRQAALEDYSLGAGIYYPTTNPNATIWTRIRPVGD